MSPMSGASTRFVPSLFAFPAHRWCKGLALREFAAIVDERLEKPGDRAGHPGGCPHPGGRRRHRETAMRLPRRRALFVLAGAASAALATACSTTPVQPAPAAKPPESKPADAKPAAPAAQPAAT